MRMAIFDLNREARGRTPPKASSSLTVLMAVLTGVTGVMPGCITQPEDRHGNPQTTFGLMGIPADSGEGNVELDRGMGGEWQLERICLPDGRWVMVVKNARWYRIPQAQLDMMDAETRLAFFKAMANLGLTYMSAGVGSYYFGFTKPRSEENLNIDGRWSEQWNGTLNKTVQKRIDTEAPDPD